MGLSPNSFPYQHVTQTRPLTVLHCMEGSYYFPSVDRVKIKV